MFLNFRKIWDFGAITWFPIDSAVSSFGIPSHTDDSAGHLERLGRRIVSLGKF